MTAKKIAFAIKTNASVQITTLFGRTEHVSYVTDINVINIKHARMLGV